MSSGSLVGGIVGAVIGAFTPIGPAYGYAIGSAAGSLVAPQIIDGPRLGELRVQNASFGAFEPIAYGGVRLGGNILWTTNLVEHEGEGGKGGPSVNNFTYTVSCAINICAGEVESVRRIWADAKLVYDATDTATEEALAASAVFAEFFVLYPGSETQDPDPTIEADVGAGNCPAYLGSCYIVFTDLPLVDYGNRIPSFTFEISTEEQGDVPSLPDPVTDLIVGDGAGVNHGTVEFDWSAGAGATTYTVRRQRNGAAWSTVVAGLTSPGYGDNLSTTFDTDLGVIYTYQVISVNADGATYGNMVSIRYMGNIDGAGSYTSDQWVEQCALHWTDPTHIGRGNPGAEIFGNFCFRYDFFGNFAGGIASTDAALEVVGEVPAPNALDTIGIVPPGSANLGDIVRDICLRCRLTEDQIDVSALTDTVDGYIVSKQMPGRSAIDGLRQAFYFDAVESGEVLKFVKRGGASVVTIAAADLGAGVEQGDDPNVMPFRAQETDLPSRINLSYMAKTRDFETGTQPARRMTTGSQQIMNLDLAIVMSDQKAREVVEVLMYDVWTSRTTRTWNTTRKYAKYEPTDVMTLNDGEFTYVVRATEKSEEGPIIRWKGVDEQPAVYRPDVIAALGSGSSRIRIIGAAGAMRLEVIDSPIVRDVDNAPGYYVAGGGYADSWASGRAYQSIDGGSTYTSVQDVSNTATIGDAQTILGGYLGGNTVDAQNSLVVKLTSGTLSSITRAQLLNGGNLAWLGGELVQFQRANLLAEDTYLLSGLLRGRKGTEQFMGAHAVFDHFVLMDNNVYRETDPLPRVNLPTKVKGITTGASLGGVTAADFTDTGASIKPLSPVHLAAIDAGGGDYAVKWVRRSRIAVDRIGAIVDAPLAETSEQYRVEVLTAGVVVGSQTVTSQTATVTASSGDVVRVRQLSSLVGPGFPAEVEIA